MYRKCVLLLLVVVVVAPLLLKGGVLATPTKSFNKANGLCPSTLDIAPCQCIEQADGKLDMDCSEVTNTEQLQTAFQATFPFTAFNSFTLTPTIPSPNLIVLPHGVFGDISFQYIYISGTDLEIVEEEAFTASKTTLVSLSITQNRVQSFPFETLPIYTGLHILDLTENMLPYLPDIVSSPLRYLTLTGNIGLSFDTDTFPGANNIIEINLNHMQISSLQSNLFSQLNYIEHIDLSRNHLSGQLQSGFMVVPIDSLKVLDLNDNQITDIADGAISGVDRSVLINLQNNAITRLPEDQWVHLIDQITRINSIDLRGNPLACGCDVLWLVRSEDKMAKIHENTTCADKTMYLHDVPLEVLVNIC
ncbi:hypothetical protein Pmani_023043 [Petrolisthes manimaculis]|uniref:Oplophorus-luciferin 2-monooxygenase non-catalytic subunit n=1 Tax=Petrolisthes manimaculis TaxID=1843537 RepID=A0AAE1PAX4_9EUCA|nr:hypothetical protein Pmani_023043 [Petrolisthes manimaculis]